MDRYFFGGAAEFTRRVSAKSGGDDERAKKVALQELGVSDKELAPLVERSVYLFEQMVEKHGDYVGDYAIRVLESAFYHAYLVGIYLGRKHTPPPSVLD